MEQYEDNNFTTILPPTEPPYYPSNDTCNYINRTDYQYVDHWEGIPENILLNVVSWLVSMLRITVRSVENFLIFIQIFLPLQILLTLFSVLRKRAWNYGRIALVQKTEEK